MKIIGFAILIAVVLGAAIFGAIDHFAKQRYEAVSRRLTPIWPDIMQMEMLDRALIVYLADRCELLKQPEGRRETIACLESAAASDQARKHFQNPVEQLRRLIPAADATPPKQS